MCGAAGIYAYGSSAPSVNERELLAIRDRMSSRGPDGAGLWLGQGQRIGLAHRRLAIIDLSDAAAQPMVSHTGHLIVTFNGEIYNYQALRSELVGFGYKFTSHSDTEVLLHLYDYKGADMLHDLRGMFAFAIWDARKQELFLARDVYGIKPLYYSDAGGTFRFASSVKALLAGGAVSSEPDLGGQAGFYLTGSVPEPFTVFSAIRALPAGSWMKVSSTGAGEITSFLSVAQIFEDAQRRAEEVAEEGSKDQARTAFLDSVRHHIVADVPIGAFLSAGVDSSALVGLMCDAGAAGIQTVTLRFGEFRGVSDDEAPLAAQVAAQYGTNHSTRVITQREFADDLPKIMDAMDQPSIDGVNSWFVSKAMREVGVKVAISGIGGDELLGGYPSFYQIPRWRRRTGLAARIPGMGVAVRQLARTVLSGFRLSPKAYSAVEFGGDVAATYLLRRGLFLPWELERLMGREAANEGLARLRPLEHIRARLRPQIHSDYAAIATLESSLYMRNQLLRDVDWASMAHSLEVRVPLVDVQLSRSIAPLVVPSGINKGKEMLAYAPLLPLPREVSTRPKTGFSVPIGAWANGCRPIKQPVYQQSRSWAKKIASAFFAGAPGAEGA